MKYGALVLVAVLGCSSKQNVFDDGGESDDSSVADDSGIITTGDGGEGGGGKRSCSSDLQSVVDDSGNTVEVCPPDKGCSGGQCVPACQAAADAKGSIGCRYVVATPAFTLQQPCFAMFVANNWGKDAIISVKRDNQSFNVTSFGRIPNGTNNVGSWAPVPSTGIPPGKVAVLYLSSSPTASHPIGGPMTCPVTPAVNAITALTSTGRGKAFEVTVDVPVTAYDIHPFGGARSFLPSAQLLLPTTAWGDNFVAVEPLGNGGSYWGQIIAQENGTTVDVVPTVALPMGTNVVAAPQNQKTSFTLQAGELIHWFVNGDMGGSILSSNKPIAYVGGLTSQCMGSMTSSGGGCDSSHQLVPPIKALGNEYAVAPYTTRRADLMEESIVYRIVGAQNGTTLTYDPPSVAGPKTLSLGEVQKFEATGAFVVRSQDDKHPFYVGQGMTGCNVTSGSRPGITTPPPFNLSNCLGDEDYVVTLPPAQYLSKYVFFTDPTYATTTLTLTRVKGASGFRDVSVACLGNVSGWKPIGTGGKYEWTTVDLARANMPVGSCKNGGQVASSDGAFGVVVWGTDVYASYGYPAGGNVGAINTVVVPPTPK